MIRLHVFGPNFGLIDPSQFCLKGLTLMRMSGLPFETTTAGFNKAPKGKFPVLDDSGQVVPDSTLIRFHLEKKHGINFDSGVSAEGAAIGWAFEKLCEDHLYWAVVYDRWMVDANFDRGPRKIFNSVPAPIRPLIVKMVLRKVRKDLWSHGFGRHSPAERLAIVTRGVRALAERLSHTPFIGGDQPCGSDAAVFGCVASLLTDFFDSALNDEARRHPSLFAYRDRMMALYFPEELKKAA
jgi:glutathione S-transferase